MFIKNDIKKRRIKTERKAKAHGTEVLPAMRFTIGPSRLQIRWSVGNTQDLGLRSLTAMDEFDSVPIKQRGQVSPLEGK